MRRSLLCLCLLTCLAPSPALAQDEGPAQGAADPLFDDPLFGDDDIEFDETEEPAGSGFPDPWEAGNRPVLAFNSAVDRYLLNPVTRGYQAVVPSPVRLALRRFMQNIDSAPIFVNDVLQLEWKDAGVTVGRFALNSTLGLGGLFDPATSVGLPLHKSDFGQTLALAGTPSGNYVMLPLFGPNTVRDSLRESGRSDHAPVPVDPGADRSRVVRRRGRDHHEGRVHRRDDDARGLVGGLLRGAPQRLLPEPDGPDLGPATGP